MQPLFLFSLVILLAFVAPCPAEIIDGKYWQLGLNSSNLAAPYQPTPLAVVLQGCGDVTEFINVKYRWVYGGARVDLGELDSEITQSPTTTHDFRGTGRRTLSITACVNETVSGSTWCNGEMISGTYEILVQYVRKELRDLPSSEWDLWVDAFWKLKTIPQSELFSNYGPFARSYDWLTALHMKSVLNATCDQAHFWTAFHPAHRIYTRLCELAVQSIYPSLALPYWDQTYDQEHYSHPFTESPIFGANFFGGAGNPSNFYTVTNGRFAGSGKEWTVPQASTWLDLTKFPASPFGYLRAPWNANPSTTFTRIPNDYLGFQDPRDGIHWVSLANEATCLNSSSFSLFHYCRDSPFEGAHPWPHVILGGAINPTYGDTTTIYPDAPSQFGLSTSRIIFASPMLLNGIATCPTSCSLNSISLNDNSNCLCACSPGPFSPPQVGFMTALAQQLGLPVPPILDATDPRNMCSIGGILGEMDDTAASPNDPIFFFFHSDVDRVWYNWQLGHIDLGIYGDFPEVGFCPGHGLHDVLMGVSGPTPKETDLGDETTPFIIAQIIERTLPPEFGAQEISPWRYEPFSQWGGSSSPNSYLPPFPTEEYCSISSVLIPPLIQLAIASMLPIFINFF